jgi:hypothetical protein
MIKDLLLYLYLFSIFIWFIPPIRQYRTEYFLFFLIVAFADVFSILFNRVFNIEQYIAFNLLSYFAMLSLLNINKFQRYLILYIIIFFVILYLTSLIPDTKQVIFLLIHVTLLYMFLRRLIDNIYFNSYLSVFLLMLIFYEFTIITKFLNLVAGFTDANYYYIITSIFQILFGLFFSIFREGDNRLVFQLK